MKLIILRGLPGCGKSTIAEILSENLECSVVYGDFFKREFLVKNKNFQEACEYSYKKIFEEVEKYAEKKEEVVIIEELFDNKEFVERIKNFCRENNIQIYWFYIKRELEKLLEVEQKRDRKIKNTVDDFKKLQDSLNEIKNEGEIVVDNNGNIEESINFVLNKI
ncbi:MAG: AAA family ATPase [Candidatus Pacebacteria bacterium]|nr:AAA family ATPase [Candidatus Paceibacterota bacterium]